MSLDSNPVRVSLRQQMPVSKKWAYFDHAAVAPLTLPAQQAIAQWLVEAAEEGDTVWLDWAHKLKDCRRAAAELIGAEPREIALLPNTTAGINVVAEGIDWQAGDNVVTLDDEFPSNLYPWLNLEDRGVETRRVPTYRGQVTPEQIAAHCDENTRVVSVSWVGYANGCRRTLRPLADVAHAVEALFFVDAIQGLGIFPLDVEQDGIDALAADGHKWMLGPEGAGIAYISPQALDRLRPTGVGWNSVVQGSNFDLIELNLKPNASRYEGGTYAMAGFLGLGASLQLLLELGVENIAAAILEYHDFAARELAARGAELFSPETEEDRAGIISFALPERDPLQVRRAALELGVALACRGGRLRISPHAYNDTVDLERLLAVVDEPRVR